jgi:hypothetical protein
MGERDKDEGRAFALAPINQSAAARERQMRMLRRLSHALGRPVEDFFKAEAEPDGPRNARDGDDPERDR